MQNSYDENHNSINVIKNYHDKWLSHNKLTVFCTVNHLEWDSSVKTINIDISQTDKSVNSQTPYAK